MHTQQHTLAPNKNKSIEEAPTPEESGLERIEVLWNGFETENRVYP